MKIIKNVFLGILVILAGYVGVFMINLIGSVVLHLLFISDLNTYGVPLTLNAQIIYLIFLIMSGFVGAFIIAVLAKYRNWFHWCALCFLAIIGDIIMLQGQLSVFPVWIEVILIATIPLQIWLGGRVGIKLRYNYSQN